MDSTLAYQNLNPETLINAIESLGFQCDARILALNSYENRVYRVGIEDQAPIIAKFYRPNRWTEAQIQEEHEFTLQCQTAEIPVIAPITHHQQTLFHYDQFIFSIYPLKAGRAPDFDNPEHLKWLGRTLGRMHAMGANQAYQHRLTINIKELAEDAAHFINSHDFLPDYLAPAYQAITQELIPLLKHRFEHCQYTEIRLHGDCHSGNILWSENLPHFVDFDDSRMGPAIQDFWMFLSGSVDDQKRQINDLLEGYTQFYDFDPNECQLIEPLRTMRLIHYSGWLAKRWKDPAFPLNFPWFNTTRYWEEHILQLKEQRSLLDEFINTCGNSDHNETYDNIDSEIDNRDDDSDIFSNNYCNGNGHGNEFEDEDEDEDEEINYNC